MLVFILHFRFNFICRNNIVALHIFQKLVCSARLFIKMASWGCCLVVLDSSGEAAACT